MRSVVFSLPLILALTASVLAASVLATSVLADEPIVRLTIKDHQFIPSEVPVPAGVKVKLVVKNEQTMNAEFESTSLHREKLVNAGAEVAVFVGPLDPGSYEFLDDFHSDTRGRLVVK